RAVLPALVRPDRAAAREGAEGGRGLRVPACKRASLPGPAGPRGADRTRRVRRSRVPHVRRRDRRPAHGDEAMTGLPARQETPGLHGSLEELEERLEQTVRTHPGLVAAVSGDALSAGGKRLRPLLVFFATPPGQEPSVAAGAAVELVHMATLVHDDLIDGA